MMGDASLSAAAGAMGRKGGRSRTPAKIRASLANLAKARAMGRNGGWPKGRPRKPQATNGGGATL